MKCSEDYDNNNDRSRNEGITAFGKERGKVFYHVRITPKSDRSHDEVKLDLSVEELEARFLGPYREGRPIVIGGRTIPAQDIERLRITATAQSSDFFFPVVRHERAASKVFAPISDEWYVAAKGKDVSDEFVKGPPGEGVQFVANSGPGPSKRGPRVVFVVHGRNIELRNSMFSLLRAIGLEPLEWNEAVQATGKPSPYVGEILDTAFAIAQAIVVVFSPDDEAQLRESLRGPNEPLHETQLTPQARPNVIFEAGMAMGRDANRTVLVEIGELRPFSDLGGRHVLRLNNTTQRRQELAQRLQSAGCAVNTAGTDWHTTGNFELDAHVQ